MPGACMPSVIISFARCIHSNLYLYYGAGIRIHVVRCIRRKFVRPATKCARVRTCSPRNSAHKYFRRIPYARSVGRDGHLRRNVDLVLTYFFSCCVFSFTKIVIKPYIMSDALVLT